MRKERTLLTSQVDKLLFPAFNLPALKTCPGKTESCSIYCYARRHHYAMKSTKERVLWNYCQSRKPEFVDRMKTELYQLSYNRLNRVRIHPSGDFYNQEYFNNWVDIAREFPSVVFTAYTRSYSLILPDNFPSNFILFYSVDKTTKHFPNWKNVRTATVINKKNYIAHPAVKTSYTCNSKCHSCKFCYSSKVKKDLIFRSH